MMHHVRSDVRKKHTAAVGLGQQWMAAPACMPAMEDVGNGNLPTSALSRMYLLH